MAEGEFTSPEHFNFLPESKIGAFAPYKRFAQQNLGGGRIHFARAFNFLPESKEVTTYVVTSF
ncbi:MAG: hypothetical protein ACLRSD_14345 [Oscillibacter sp.]